MGSTTQIRDETAELPLRAIDFSDNPAVMHVSTSLRRLWEVDPSSLIPETQPEELKELDFGPILQEAFQKLGKWVSATPDEERWDDAIWRERTDFVLLNPPMDWSSADGNDDEARASLFSPYRHQIYGVYNHVFWDVYNTLKDTLDYDVGEFKPPNTTIMVLDVPSDEPAGITHLFSADTFVYPVWIQPDTRFTFNKDGVEHTVLSDGNTWKSALWCQGGQLINMEAKGPDGEWRTGVVAILALGECEPRLLPQFAPKDYTIGPLRVEPSQAKHFEDGEPETKDKDTPESWPEADHLARAIFLQAGDAVGQCTFDDVYVRIEEDEPSLEALSLENPESDEVSLYSPLPGNNTIRILIIEPATAPQDPLQTRLVVANLDDKPAFEAISYTWGNPTDKTLLKCNGSAVPIPRNLENNLKRLRHTSRPRYVWADSVCINQEDIPERGQQVSIMRKIYQSAERVLVWIGLDEEYQASKAFKAVCNIVRAWRPDTDSLMFYSYAAKLEAMSDDNLSVVRASVDQEAWEALRAMFEADYFRRFWIIQELALGSSAVVLWGDHHISWGLIGICASWIMTSGWHFNYGSPITAAYNAFLIYVLPLAKRSGISQFSKLDLSVVLGTTMGRFDSTDARDRIYALLGMPFAGNDPDSQLLLNPDYSQSTRSVYIQAARKVLEQDQHLRMLSAVQHGPELDTAYPSWVPKWFDPSYAEPLALRDEQGYYANGGELFCPSDDTFSADGEALILSGLVCGTVAEVSEEMKKGDLRFQALSKESHRGTMKSIFDQLNDEDKQLRASWSATLEKFILFGFNNPEVQLEVRDNGTGAAVTGQPGKYGMRLSAELLLGERAQNDHLGEFLLYWRERASWQCDDGKSGLGPAATQPGDIVAVLFGGVVPFILRPVNDGPEGESWKLIGECFVPGLMQGEAVEEAGLLEPGSFNRYGGGSLTLTPGPADGSDPRLHRKLCAVGGLVAWVLGCKNGYGRHQDTIDQQQFVVLLEAQFVQSVVEASFAFGFLKISIALSLLRLHRGRWYKWILWGLVGN
ncbi:heterokaryon incompatibility protein-domain-containing protein [Bombardia bombarda]|uniref:Heterokaryon incompatibility protein-domain-containing protein n=1 Tax=Bombardia bombarda TaxID=252184 RepID=A0AA39X0T0_9PEZI|nr:heterokaryon incompatibility protein-domain-containing protein [Bombardia bombarda]